MAVSEERFLEWIIDSGGSFHMTPRKDFLFDLKEFNGGTVLLGDNRACAIMGIRKVRVQLKDGLSFVLENVRDEGFFDGFVRNYYVYSLDGWAESGEASVGIQEKESLAHVWNKRLGHISEAGLHELERRDVLRNKGLGKLELCENCVLGKWTRVSFGRGQHTTEGVIDYVHADLWGPSRVESMSGCRYFLSIVDDYLRRVWLHFLRHKNKAFSKFKEWKQLVGNQTGRKLKKLQTDNGLEFCNQEFNNLCKESEIAIHLTSGLPDSFWAEATMTAAYLINRSMDLWIDDIKPKIIISRVVVFNESLMYKDTLKGAGAADSRKEVEFEVELQGSRVEPTVDPHSVENPGNEDEEQDEDPQQQNLDNYVLVRDRAKRIATIPARYRDEGNVSLSRPSGSKVMIWHLMHLLLLRKKIHMNQLLSKRRLM
ncbi:retrovirus-related pol polyprotein from transposon TNT 1-94 [Tanacetum coccineum]